MKYKIIRIFSLGIILFASFYLCLGGCHKKLVHGDKVGGVEGFVKDSLSLTPLIGADVFVDDYIFEPFPKTDSIGYYQVVELVGDFRLVKITIKAVGFEIQEKNVTLEPNQMQRLDFFLVRESEL